MSHSLTKIWIHGIFRTKDSNTLIQKEFEDVLYLHIREKLETDFECQTRVINGTNDHVHVLFLLNPNYSIKEIFQGIKGESSHWINQNNFVKYNFAWQKGYAAFSVSESNMKEVERYIKDQKEHHKKRTFMEEYDIIMKKFGFVVTNR